MHLVRRHAARKTKRHRTYLYIRSSAYGYSRIRPDIALGRMDRREPKKTVEKWLESSDNLPEALRYRLTRDDVLELYEAIHTGGKWVRLDRFHFARDPKQNPRFEWCISKDEAV